MVEKQKVQVFLVLASKGIATLAHFVTGVAFVAPLSFTGVGFHEEPNVIHQRFGKGI